MNSEDSPKYYLFEMQGGSLNVISILILIIVLVVTFAIDRDYIFMRDIGWCIILLIPYLVLHELLHSLSYVLHGARPKNITFGAHLEKGILCCLCKENVTRRNILTSLLYPFFFIGILTYIIGLVMNSDLLVTLSIFNISGCSGDLLMFFNLSRIKNFEYSEYDNPLAFGLYSKEDLGKKKMLGLKYVGSAQELARTDLKKVTISKTSALVFVMLFILGIINILIA